MTIKHSGKFSGAFLQGCFILFVKPTDDPFLINLFSLGYDREVKVLVCTLCDKTFDKGGV